MGARHASSFVEITKNKAFSVNTRTVSELQKISTIQNLQPFPHVITKGGGQAVGSGTSYPVLAPIKQLGTQGANIVINLAGNDSHYQTLVLTDPGSPINISFTGLIMLKTMRFSLDIIVGTTSLPSINWPATLFNLPTLPTNFGDRYVLEIVGYRNASEERYTVINGVTTSGGGGGLTFPIVAPVIDHGSVGGGIITLNLSATTAHVHLIKLTGDEAILFSGAPPNLNNIQFQIVVTQDATGGRTITWPVSVNVPPTQGKGPNQRVVYLAQTSDNGTTYDVFNTDMASTIANIGFAKTNLSNLVSTAANLSLVATADDSLNLGSQIKRWNNTFTHFIKWVAGREIDLKTSGDDGIYYYVNATERHSFQVVGTGEVLSVNSSAISGVNINAIFSKMFSREFSSNDDTLDATLYGGTDAAGHGAKVIVAGKTNIDPFSGTGAFSVWTPNAAGTSDIQRIKVDGVVNSGLGQISFFQKLSMSNGFIQDVLDPVLAQDAATKHYVDNITTGANTALSNLANPTSINRSLIPNADGTIDVGSSSRRWSAVFCNNVGTSINTELNFDDAVGISYLVPTGKKHSFQVNSVEIIQVNSTKMIPGATATIDIGSSTKFFKNLYTAQHFFTDVNTSIQNDGSGDLLFTVGTTKFMKMIANTTDYVKWDFNLLKESLLGGMFFEILPSGGNPFQITKLASSPAEITSAEGIQFDNSINIPFNLQNTPYTLTDSDWLVYLTVTGNANLPSSNASRKGRWYIIVAANCNLTINASGVQKLVLVDGTVASSITLNSIGKNQILQIVADGNGNWAEISRDF